MNDTSKTLILNICIICLLGAVALYLQNPLALIGLFWLHQLPESSYNEEEDEAVTAEYEDTTMGFTGKLKD